MQALGEWRSLVARSVRDAEAEGSSPSSPTNPYSYVFVPMASEERISKGCRCSAEYVFAPMDRREFMMLRDIYVTDRWLLKHIVCKGEAVADKEYSDMRRGFFLSPYLLAAWSGNNREQAEAAGVKQVCVPATGRSSKAQRCRQHERWFRRGQRWRTASEGRVSVLKRRDGLILQRDIEVGALGWLGRPRPQCPSPDQSNRQRSFAR
jgi:hypothetical protein